MCPGGAPTARAVPMPRAPEVPTGVPGLPGTPVVSADMARARDREAPARGGLGAEILQERAALEMRDWLRTPGPAVPTLLLAGPGNNGADALALARLLSEDGCPVEVCAWPRSEPGELWLLQSRRLESRGVPVVKDPDGPGLDACLSRAHRIIDGIAGLGLSGPLRPPLDGVVRQVARAVPPGAVVAIDLPSGVREHPDPSDPVLPAGTTLCLDRVKECCFLPLLRPLCGTLVRLPIGIPDHEGDDSLPLLLDGLPGPCRRAPDPFAHKMTRGRLDILAGSTAYPGAALLAARGGLAADCGIIHLHVPRELSAGLAMAEPVLVVHGNDDPATATVIACQTSPGAILAGPGWTGDHRALLEFLLGGTRPLVLDAAALRLCATMAGEGAWKPPRCLVVMTPHQGEADGLAAGAGLAPGGTPSAGGPRAIADMARFYGAWILRKGPVHLLAAPDGRIWILDHPEPFLARAGSGDIFAGFLAGCLASGHACPQAIRPSADGASGCLSPTGHASHGGPDCPGRETGDSGARDRLPRLVLGAVSAWLQAGALAGGQGVAGDHRALAAILARISVPPTAEEAYP